MKMKNEKVKGVVLSYSTVILQVLINLVLTPILIKAMGVSEYGLYETINSLGTTILVINFGISSIVSRNIVKYNQENETKKLENFLGMCSIISFCIMLIIIILGLIAVHFIPNMYENSLNSLQLEKAKYMFLYIIFNLSIFSWHNFTNGIIVGNEKFFFASLSKLLKQVVKVALILILIFININAVSIVICDLIVTIVIIIVEMIYCFVKLKIRIKFYNIDFKILKEVFLFSLASILQTITNQINLSLDKVILGVMMSTEIVAKYSIGMLLVGVMVSIMQVISTVYLPDATKLVMKGSSGGEMTDFVISPGRIQLIIGCIIVFEFALVGKDFLTLWLGNSFSEIWFTTLLLLSFTMLVYITSVANVILDAMLKKLYRSLILIATAILNVIITIVLIKPLGYFGAALGTIISLIVGNIIVLNIYYKKLFGLQVIHMYYEIFKGILISAFGAFLITYCFKFLLQSIILKVAISSIFFIVLFGLLLFLYGLNYDEKVFVKKILHIK